jgi:hypothetical protein
MRVLTSSSVEEVGAMSVGVRYPQSAEDFDRVLGEVGRVLHTDHRLPMWPFAAAAGHADICQFSLAIAGPFGPVLQALAATYADEAVSFVVLDPSPDYYRENYGSYPTFVAPGKTIAAAYWDLVSYEPGGDATGAATYTANVVALVGSSGAWAVWAERSWDLAIVLSQHVNGPWASCGVPFVPVEEALRDFTEPDFKVPLTPQARLRFLDNVRERGLHDPW